MIYLSQMLGKPVVDATGDEIGTINDIAIATGEVFPRVTSLAFRGPDKTPFMLSWRKFVAEFDGEHVALNVTAPEIRFSYLQPDEVLLARDLLNRQIVDTQGMKVVRVNDLKLSESRNQLRLLGAEVGVRGIMRGISPALETAVSRFVRIFGREVAEDIIAWNYMDLLDRDLSQVKLSVTHKRLHELHPADVADIMEQLPPSQRAKVFEHLENTAAADAISELEDELQADVIDDLSERRASVLLAEMDPDDAADIIGDLPYEKAERLLRLMGLKDATQIRGLLGYKEKTAGGIMTPEVTTVTDEMTVQEVIEHIRRVAQEQESIYYVYVVEGDNHLTGVISLRDLLLAKPDALVSELARRDLFTAGPDDDQEDVADDMSKYDLLALPVVDETGKLLGIVTVDDALDVLEEEAEEDLAIATGRRSRYGFVGVWQWVSRDGWLIVWSALFLAGALLARNAPALGSPLLLAFLMVTVVLRLAEDVASHALSRAVDLEDPDKRTPLWRRLVNDLAAGSALAIVIAGVALLVLEVWADTPPLIDTLFADAPLFPYQVWVALALGTSVVAVTLAGTIAGEIVELRARAERSVSAIPAVAALGTVAALTFVGVLVPVIATSSAFDLPLF